jgi:hypothetical protein
MGKSMRMSKGIGISNKSVSFTTRTGVEPVSVEAIQFARAWGQLKDDAVCGWGRTTG